MNYFAHAVRHLDRPHFLAGLALPDWLSVVDRQVRLRPRRIMERRELFNAQDRDIADGALQHLDDDRWFHGTPGFYNITARVAAEFRLVLGNDESWQCGFLGHVVSELLLDAALVELQPQLLDEYYALMEHWNPQQIEFVVNQLAERETTRLAEFVTLFIRERFLFDYQDDESLLRRLNQVMRRVQLAPLPYRCVDALAASRIHVRNNIDALLPHEHFPELSQLRG